MRAALYPFPRTAAPRMGADETDYDGTATFRPTAVNKAAQFLIAAIIIAGLYLGRDILIPLALAVFLSFILAPLVRYLRAWRLGRMPSVLIIVTAAFLMLASIAGFVGHQLTQLADNLPRYESTIRAKVDNLKQATASNGVMSRLSNMLRDLSGDISASSPKPEAGPETPSSTSSAPAPLPVEIQTRAMTPFQAFKAIMSPALNSLATAGLVLVFVIFILLQREDIRDRFIRLTGLNDLNRSTSAIDDAVGRLSRLFLIQTVINVAFGIVIGCGLWLIGVPGAALWGILSALLRFVPYIGALISAAFPIAMAAAVDPGWQLVGWTVVLFAVTEPIVGHGIEPLLHGQSTGLSPVAIVIAAAFWTWLWGPIGLILSTPLTVCLTSLGRHVDGLAFFDVLFGARPALTLPQRFYQRLLANHPDEAIADAEAYMADHSAIEYYDAIALPGMEMASLDLRRGKLSADKIVKAAEAIEEIVEDIDEMDEDDEKEKAEDEAAASTGPAAADTTDYVLCLPGRSIFDEAAAQMLAGLLTRRGRRAVVQQNATRFDADLAKPKLICLSYFGIKFSPTHVRFLVRRIKRHYPDVPILTCYWMKEQESADTPDAASSEVSSDAPSAGDLMATSMQQAVDLCMARLDAASETTRAAVQKS